MSEVKHTPGPWEVSKSGNGMGSVKAGKFTLSHRWDGPAGQEEMDANARLIAAAPDLLEHLKASIEALEWFGITGGGIQEAKEAVAKAEGRS